MLKYHRLFYVLVAIALIPISVKYSGGEMSIDSPSFKSLAEVPVSKWNSLSEKTIFFAHQSVGKNIVLGMREVIDANKQINMSIEKIENSSNIKNSGFSHSYVEKNGDPISKINNYTKMVRQADGKIDISFVKFCFVDIESETNITNIFNYYKKEMSKLKKEYPDTLFIHFTVPLLKRVKPTITSRIAKIFKKKDAFWDDEHNIAINNYNNLVLNAYKGVEPVFDIAMVESTFTSGDRAAFEMDGKTYYSLVPEYTNDGGHLNEKGRLLVAEQLLIFLASQL